MKRSYKEEIKIYSEWKFEHKSAGEIARERNLNCSSIKYMVRPAEHHMITHGALLRMNDNRDVLRSKEQLSNY